MNEITYYIIGFQYEGEYANFGLFTTEEAALKFVAEKELSEDAYVRPIKVNP